MLGRFQLQNWFTPETSIESPGLLWYRGG